MADRANWRGLDTELKQWEDAGRVVDLWLRDDDAITPTPALNRLIASAGGHAVPVTLAVIPADTGEPLAARLSGEPDVTVAVHGWAHRNHASAGAKKAELGQHRPVEVVAAELAGAKSTIDRLFGERALPMLVPPWNRIAPDIVPRLSGLGFAALSVYGRAGHAPLPLVNTHVDIIDWHGSRGGKDHDELIAGLIGELCWRRETGSEEPLGFLTHHLVHDEAAWSFLDRLFAATSGKPACRWVGARALI